MIQSSKLDPLHKYTSHFPSMYTRRYIQFISAGTSFSMISQLTVCCHERKLRGLISIVIDQMGNVFKEVGLSF